MTWARSSTAAWCCSAASRVPSCADAPWTPRSSLPAADADPRALRALSAREIVRFVADAAERWRDADFAPRVRATAAIRERLGYSEPVVDVALDRLFGSIRADALAETIASELGAVAALDGAVARGPLPPAQARGVDRALIVSSDTT